MTDIDRHSFVRQARQRLESLRRYGVDRIPRPPELAPTRLPTAPEPMVTEPPYHSPAAEPIREAVPPARPAPAVATSLFGETGLGEPPVPVEERAARLDELAREVAACTRCPLLADSRTQTVFGEGSPMARLMFIGEAPGADEDRTGRPFVGRAGVLLTDMITKGMGLRREDVFIANILKSRPPENRNPLPDEVAHCLPFLERQLAIIRPEYLCLLGKIAASTLLETALPMGRLRGKWHRYRGIPTLVTWHPAYLLRNPAAKKEAWEDLQMLMNAMGLRPPERKKG